MFDVVWLVLTGRSSRCSSRRRALPHRRAHGRATSRRATRRPTRASVELEDVDYRYQCIVCGAQARALRRARGRDPRAAPPLPGADGPGHPGRVATRLRTIHRLWTSLWGITRLRFGHPPVSRRSPGFRSASRPASDTPWRSAIAGGHHEAAHHEQQAEDQVAVLGVAGQQRRGSW